MHIEVQDFFCVFYSWSLQTFLLWCSRQRSNDKVSKWNPSVSLSYPDQSPHDIGLLGLGFPKVLEVEGTYSKLWSFLCITNTNEEVEEEERRGPHGSEQYETVTLCTKTKTYKGDLMWLNIYSLCTQKVQNHSKGLIPRLKQTHTYTFSSILTHIHTHRNV